MRERVENSEYQSYVSDLHVLLLYVYCTFYLDVVWVIYSQAFVVFNVFISLLSATHYKLARSEMSLLQSLSTANSEYSERGSKDLWLLPPPGALERSSLGLLSPEEDEVGCRNLLLVEAALAPSLWSSSMSWRSSPVGPKMSPLSPSEENIEQKDPLFSRRLVCNFGSEFNSKFYEQKRGSKPPWIPTHLSPLPRLRGSLRRLSLGRRRCCGRGRRGGQGTAGRRLPRHLDDHISYLTWCCYHLIRSY